MNKLLFLILIVSNISLGQSSMEFNFNHAYIGRNISVDYRYDLNSVFLNAGVTYHINRIETLPSGVFYKNAGLANKTIQRFGIQFGGGYRFYENKFCKIELYYKGYIASMDSYVRLYNAYEPVVPNPQNEEDYAVIINNVEFGPVFIFENTIGLSVNAKLFDNISICLRGGFGHMLYRVNDNDITIGSAGQVNKGFVFTSSYSLGLRYIFNH